MLFLKIIAGVAALWVIWYVTGGPLRSTGDKPFVSFDNGQLLYVAATSSEKR